ncbi:MAG: peptide chain release factor 2 [Christensenellaceae bacterium]|jgi:peptide chain release factor 2|nr:peptide chain release factor 2 [Christensenellaceae bacterium]
MLDFNDIKQSLLEASKSIKTSATAIDVEKLNTELEGLHARRSESDYWTNIELAQEDGKRISLLEKKIDTITNIECRAQNIAELISIAEEMEDETTIADINALITDLKKDASKLFLETLLSGKYDSLNAILSLHAGAGGTEAQDWVEMLYRMYSRYAEKAGYKITVLDSLPGDGAGIKSITFLCAGAKAYGFLKAEKGVHRLVRISPFDTNKRRHTSFASLEVMPEILDESEIKINPEELRIDTFRSSGAGGQHVNKTESAIRITHIPTGIVVQCQNERSQIQNRDVAMRLLIGKLIEKREREQQEINQSIKGNLKKIEWGSQIRSYVFCPYTLVKDHRTGYEETNVTAVMDGEISEFIYAYLSKL